MFRFLLLFLFIQPVVYLNGQTVSFTADDLSIPQKHYLYAGVDNHITVNCEGVNPKDLVVSINNGEISGSNGSYNIRVKGTGKVIMTISKKGADKALLGEIIFLIRLFPDPMPSVAGKTGGTIQKDELLTAGGLSVSMPPDCLHKLCSAIGFNVVSFSMTVNNAGFLFEFTSNTNRFTNDQIDQINQLKPGQKLFFENIKAIGSDSIIRYMGAMAFKITE
ncbi:MAG: GldM family protein [Bacteroidota bacterium]